MKNFARDDSELFHIRISELKIDEKSTASFEMWCWRRLEISWTDRFTNEEVLQRVKKDRNILQKINERSLILLVTPCVFRNDARDDQYNYPYKTRYWRITQKELEYEEEDVSSYRMTQ